MKDLRFSNMKEESDAAEIKSVKPKARLNFFARVKDVLVNRWFLLAVILLEPFIIAFVVGLVYSVSPIQSFTQLFTQIQNNQVVAEVSGKAKVNTQEVPVVAVISDAKTLREQNDIQSEIYKDAQNGDYVIGYTDKMVIYRRQDGSIIYDGDTPQTRLEKTQQELVDAVTNAAKNAGVIDADSQEVPSVSIVTDAKKLRDQNATFYKDAKNNDVLASFAESGILVIYRQDTQTIVNSGQFSTTIK